MTQDRLRVLFCDHLNLARGKFLPPSKIGDGATRICQSTFGVTYDKDLIPAPGSKVLENLPDIEIRYRGEDIRADWLPGTRVVVGDLWEEGSPFGACGRHALKRAIKDWQELGFEPMIGLELEAFAFQQNADGSLVPYDTPKAYVYSTGPFADPRGFTQAIWERATARGFNIDSMTSEFDTPQFEFTLTYDKALKAVDDNFLFRQLARETALEFGIVLTFMPKPILAKGGSGLHVNFSFKDKQGNNAVGEPDRLSPVAEGAIAGLMHHHRSMSALAAPTINSYQRLRPSSLSGYWRNWGGDHRGVTTRISAERGPKARLEHRMGDGASNPYTLVATTLQAARLGYVNKYPLPPRETADCMTAHDAVDGVPDTLGEALDELETDGVLMDAVGRLLCENHIFIKRDEIEKVGKLEDDDARRDFYIHYV
ncbi:glutamine synthetase [Rhizobium sp. TH2]|uniref:glutamine synthetase family protein n=1 Tax=Rhizobium sp. TH2 TaxID=2775403 RepID=UPI002157479B|nr:glutamine synthetase family protein [Rhizobium sp. TH2]UVC08021.1 glutamine synthetase [Rhizobium sp. TH2]